MFTLTEDGGRGGSGARMCSVSRGCPTGRDTQQEEQGQCDTAVALLLLCHLSLPAPSPPPLLVTRLCKRMRCQGLGKPREEGQQGKGMGEAAAPTARPGLSLPRPGFAAERRSETNHSKGFAALSSIFLPICKSGLGLSRCLPAPPKITGFFSTFRC